jgi:hypothetical protein
MSPPHQECLPLERSDANDVPGFCLFINSKAMVPNIYLQHTRDIQKTGHLDALCGDMPLPFSFVHSVRLPVATPAEGANNYQGGIR